MSPEFFCHLPFVRLQPGITQALSGGATLLSPPYEEWFAMEETAMHFHEDRYRQVAPVFVRAPLPEGATIGAVDARQEKRIEELVESTQLAAILALGGRPVYPPALSAGYVVWRGLPCDPPNEEGLFGPSLIEPAPPESDDGIQLGRIAVWIQQPGAGGVQEQWVVEQRFGPAQREWILAADPDAAIGFASAKVQEFARHFARLSLAGWGPRRSAALRCTDALTALTAIDRPLQESAVLLVAAWENLLNHRADRPLGDTFARRCAAWFAEDAAERARDQAHFRRLYGVRSDILHGRQPAAVLQDFATVLGVATEGDVRYWLATHALRAIDYLVSWYGAHPEDDDFAAALAPVAGAADAEWAPLRAKLVEGRSLGRR